MLDEQGKELPDYEVDYDYVDEYGYQYVRVRNNFDLTDETVTWLVKYTVIGGLDFSSSLTDGYDRLYWNAISSDRDVPINSSEVRVTLPSSYPTDQVGHTSYAFYNYESEYLKDGVVEFSAEDISAYTDFTIDVYTPDMQLVFNTYYSDYFSLGVGSGRLLSYGAFRQGTGSVGNLLINPAQ